MVTGASGAGHRLSLCRLSPHNSRFAGAILHETAVFSRYSWYGNLPKEKHFSLNGPSFSNAPSAYGGYIRVSGRRIWEELVERRTCSLHGRVKNGGAEFSSNSVSLKSAQGRVEISRGTRAYKLMGA